MSRQTLSAWFLSLDLLRSYVWGRNNYFFVWGFFVCLFCFCFKMGLPMLPRLAPISSIEEFNPQLIPPPQPSGRLGLKAWSTTPRSKTSIFMQSLKSRREVNKLCKESENILGSVGYKHLCSTLFFVNVIILLRYKRHWGKKWMKLKAGSLKKINKYKNI
jgi:hypothetical protein